jgi:cytochrome P450
VLAYTTAANRDPRVFSNPDRFDITRPITPDLSFGHGAHHCVGTHLARLELQTVLAALSQRLPGLRLAVDPDELAWKAGGVVRGLAALPVAW